MFGFWKGTKAKLLPTTGIEFSDGRFYTYGSGSPEGVVTATVGSFYSDTTNGVIYTKNSGTGNTGWALGASSGFPDGTQAAPGIYFASDPDTGWWFDDPEVTFVSDNNPLFSISKTSGQIRAAINSTVGVDYPTLYDGYFCRAWVNFNGTGTVAIRASGNVSSITDNGTGDYTVNFATAMPDTNYSPYVSGKRDDNNDTSNFGDIFMFYSLTTSSYRIVNCVAVNGNKQDPTFASTGVFR